MLEILMGIIGLLGLLFGVEKFKNNRNKKTIKKQEQVIVQQEKQNNVYELHQEKTLSYSVFTSSPSSRHFG